MAGSTLAEALAAFGRPKDESPRHPVLHGAAGTLVTFGLLSANGAHRITGVWIDKGTAKFLEPIATASGAAEARRLRGDSATLYEMFLAGARLYLERVEEIDERLAEVQQRGRSVPLNDVWGLQRRVAAVRTQIGRALVGLAEVGARFPEVFPGFSDAMPTLADELARVQGLANSVQGSLSDLILLRNAEEANRIAEAANQLSRTSNRIAALANTSNIRMLGLTYIALVLGLISAAVLIPNTGATILGMPTAAWVPGEWVDLVLVALAIVPIAVIFSRPWVLAMLRDLRSSEARVREGLDDLPELSAEEALPTPPRRSFGPGKPL